MTPQRWRKIEELFQVAVTRPLEQQTDFLDEACAGDESLRSEVDKLLACDGAPKGSFDGIASGVAAAWMREEERHELIGQCFDRYEILAVLGSGGMGEVYLARDKKLERKVALKLLPRQFTQDRDRLRRFEQEARAASALNHPNIITIYEIGEWNGVQFIATEYIEGETLRDYMGKPGRQLSQVLEIGLQIADALAAAHAAGIVHRDIKPANIMLRRDGYIKVLDFGLAKLSATSGRPDLTDPGRVMGTINYMSPEQALGQRVDHRADIFSLGAVLYELATGHRPFEGESDAAIYDGILNKTPPPLTDFDAQLPVGLDQIIRRALEKDREQRYQSAADLRAELKVLAQENGAIKAALVSPSADLKASRWLSWRNAAIVALVIGAIGGLWLWLDPVNKSLPPSPSHRVAVNVPSEKSIAVLPFENLSEDKENAYFAEGIQDEILTRLSRIADLKVISRSSTQKYKSAPGNLSEIGQELGVANILEGSVQRTANNAHIKVQLIKAATGERLWTQSYDRPLEDVFTVETEIAQTVAGALKIALLPAQIAKLKTPPTENAQAYDLFLRGEYEFHRAWVETAEFSGAATKAADYFRQATGIDPHFSLAYAAMARAELTEYYFGLQYGTERRTDLAEAARRNIDHSLGLTPDLATAHLALGEWYSWVNHDRSAAIEEFQRAINLDPHLTNAITRMASVAMRRGQPERAIAQLRAALPTNPREILVHRDLAAALQMQRRYAQAGESFARALALNPKDLNDIINSAWNFYRIGDLEAAERILESYPPAERSNHDFVEAKLGLLARKRDYQGMEDLVKKAPASAFTSEWSRLVTMAEIAQGLGWTELARNSFAEARTAVIAAINKDPDQPGTHQALASLNATLNRPEEAIREAQRAIELSERADNFYSASASWASLAAVYAKLGRSDDAFPILNRLVSAPTGFVIYAENLKHDPKWDRIRADPRFEKIVASLAPKEGRNGESVNR